MKYETLEQQMTRIEAFNRGHNLRTHNDQGGFTIPLWLWALVTLGGVAFYGGAYLLLKIAIRNIM